MMRTMLTNHSTLNHSVDSKHALPADILPYDLFLLMCTGWTPDFECTLSLALGLFIGPWQDANIGFKKAKWWFNIRRVRSGVITLVMSVMRCDSDCCIGFSHVSQCLSCSAFHGSQSSFCLKEPSCSWTLSIWQSSSCACEFCGAMMRTMLTNHSTLNHSVDSKHALPADILPYDLFLLMCTGWTPDFECTLSLALGLFIGPWQDANIGFKKAKWWFNIRRVRSGVITLVMSVTRCDSDCCIGFSHVSQCLSCNAFHGFCGARNQVRTSPCWFYFPKLSSMMH